MHPPLNAFFEAAPDGGQRLYLLHTPPEGRALRGAVLYAHPWAEEMNKSRRMVALASRALAADGWAVLQVDLTGCGDSSGDFGDATWAAWVDDVSQAAGWLRARHPDAPLWLWGLRAGALLAAAAAPRVEAPVHLLFWQPTLQGDSMWRQFLRLKAAAQLADGGGKAILEAARADLAAGRAVQVAGYTVNPALAQGLQVATLTPPVAKPAGRAVWLEVSSQPDPTLAPATKAALPGWEAAGWSVEAQAVHGPPFWQTAEIEDAPTLVAATRDALTRETSASAVPSTAILVGANP